MNVALYGGSFNPIHVGHTSLGAWIVEHGYADELWYLVSPHNPLKPRGDLMQDDLRLRLAQLAVDAVIEKNPTLKGRLRVSDFEFHLPRPSYTVNTLEALRNAFPDKVFILVVGADNWQRFTKWYRSEDILRHHRILVYPRAGVDLPDDSDHFTFLNDAPLFDISSTQIRNSIACDPDYDGAGLPPAVWKEMSLKT